MVPFESSSSGLDTTWTAEKLQQASYRDLGTEKEVEQRFYNHLLKSDSCTEALHQLLSENSTTTRDYSITIDTFDLLDADPILGHLLLRYPADLVPGEKISYHELSKSDSLLSFVHQG